MKTYKQKIKEEFESRNIWYIDVNGDEHQIPFAEFLREFCADETTSPKGIEPRLHIRGPFYQTSDGVIHDEILEADHWIKDQELEDDLDEVPEIYELWTWGVNGNNPKKLMDNLAHDQAEYELLTGWERNLHERDPGVPLFDSKEDLDQYKKEMAEE